MEGRKERGRGKSGIKEEKKSEGGKKETQTGKFQ